MRWQSVLLSLATVPFSSVSADEYFVFGATIEARAFEIAPAPIQRLIETSTSADFSDCMTQLGLSQTLAASYFGSVPLRLSDTGREAWLILPNEYCIAYFGAHAISYWLVERSGQRQFRILHAGRQDALVLTDEHHHGYCDLVEVYGDLHKRYRYDGSTYAQVSNPVNSD